MSDQPDSPAKKNPSPEDKKSREALIYTPISIARARRAGQHAMPATGQTRQTSTKGASTGSGSSESRAKSDHRSADSGRNGLPAFLQNSNGCMLLTLLGAVFLAGGVLGGVVGGGLLIWANNSGVVASAEETPTPTPQPTPTVVPADPPTPTPTSSPKQTPSPSDVIANVIPSVVTVINQQHNIINTQLDEGRVVGSGVVVDARGYIATNNHVVDNPGDLKVILADGRETVAELVAANPAADLAILKVGYTDLPAIEWGNSRQVRPGQVVYAIGSPLGDFPNSVSFGIVSGLNRALEIDKFVIDGLIQTDAAINRGSSGGPLITPDGKVVGINTFIIRESEERGIAEGIAFSIPADTAKNLLIPWIAAHSGESVPIPASDQ